jgi:hypothetical protein
VSSFFFSGIVTFSFSSIFIITTKQGENTKQKQQTEMKIFNCVWLLQFFFLFMSFEFCWKQTKNGCEQLFLSCWYYVRLPLRQLQLTHARTEE